MSLATALKANDVTQLPSKRDEDWKWTDLRGLLRVLPPPSEPFAGEAPVGPFASLANLPIHVVNASDPFVIRSASVEPYVVALHFAALGGGSHSASAQVEVADGGHLILLESYEGDGADYVANLDLKITVGAKARLERIVLAADGAEGVSVSIAEVTLGAEAQFAQTVLTDGARRQRIETRVAHPGAGAAVRLDGAYLLAGKRHADLTTVVEHLGVDGTTSQLTKGVVRDQSRGVFQGRIVVAEGADRTDARMGHHALILSDKAEVDAKPELLIFADDVQCAHGNTIGAFDQDALFYAQQRGMPEEVARALLTEAFVGEVIDRIEHEGAREAARLWAAKGLGL
ncbi:Fe-S cluster assembly protein SufD [Phenylobacterium sp. Root700]|uniref:Fe-S cluster assembly protein SufD n=1 Tax=Phenylobacterium sp. Root700 TaxID=1736591 RepID=UPI0007007378|nr:Fe-S cluster assembly protein SufD [Phenylobacterium sp. Root700]KRB44609.1 ABC transporter permease [Phenylobacterium sp. Root700]